MEDAGSGCLLAMGAALLLQETLGRRTVVVILCKSREASNGVLAAHSLLAARA